EPAAEWVYSACSSFARLGKCGTARVGSKGQARVGDEGEHPAFPGTVPHGDHEPQFGQQPDEGTSKGSALATSGCVAFAVRSPSGWYQGSTFQATSRSGGRPAWS